MLVNIRNQKLLICYYANDIGLRNCKKILKMSKRRGFRPVISFRAMTELPCLKRKIIGIKSIFNLSNQIAKGWCP
jgi:hypothetical protein